MVCFAEALEVDDFPLAQELNHIVHIRIVTQPQNIVIGYAGLLLSRQIFRQVCDEIAFAGHTGGAVGETGGGGRIDTGCAVHKVGVKAGVFDLLLCQVACKLVDNGANHF